MKQPWHKSGGVGWLAITAVVVAWDLLAPETLSTAFRRGAATPAGRAAVIGSWAILTAHLFAVIPQRADPVHLIIHAGRKVTSRAA